MNSGKSTLLSIILLLITFNLLTAQSKTVKPSLKAAVADLVPPVAVCDAYEQVSLTNIPTKVYASTFDDGSWDEECFDAFSMAVKRMGDPDTNFKPYIDFYCADVANSPIKVVLRVFDCAGNYNDCWSFVTVEDKTKPILVCPNDVTVDCLDDISKYWGTPNAFDNCGNVSLTFKITDATDQCQQGYVTKTWTGKDQFNNQSTCSQRIYKKHVSDYTVCFPNDTIITECIKPSDLNNTGVPTFINKDCELVAIEHIDHDFPITNEDGCFVRIRKWKLISWCNYDPFAPSHTPLGIPLGGKKYKDDDGYFEYTQYIKVFESSKPILTCKDTTVCVGPLDCTADFTIPKPAVIDCSPQIIYGITGDLGTNLQVTKVPVGTYDINYNISDGCGNHSYCSTKVFVKDCKKPTPVVINGLSTTLMVQTGQVSVWASDFNQSSFNNCTPSDKLVFSFSPDTTDKFKVFNCDSLGIRTVKIYATDQSGNYDYAVTTIDIQDNMNACDTSSMIIQLTGNVKKSNGKALSLVHLDNDLLKLVSDSLGNFSCPMMKIPMPALMSIGKLGVAKEDISILDIILVKNHILGSKKLSTPYQYLAADVNKSKSISTADILQMQQIILGSLKEWKNNTTWNFIDKSKVYEPVESILSVESSMLVLTEELPDSVYLELIGVKTGDVNAEFSQFGKLEVRGSVVFEIKKNNNLEQLIYASSEDLSGLQLALNFDNEIMNNIEFKVPDDQYFIKHDNGYSTISFLIHDDLKPGQILCSWKSNSITDKLRISDEIEAVAVGKDYMLYKPELINSTSNNKLLVSNSYPDPANSTINFNITTVQAEIVELNITDMLGKNVGNYTKELTKGYNEVALNLLLPNGSYIISFSANGEKLTRKFQILKR